MAWAGGSRRCRTLVKEDPFWLDPSDPHRAPYIKIALGPMIPQFNAFNPGMGQVNAEQLWGRAEADVIKNGMTPEQAIDKAFKRARRIFEKFSVRLIAGEASMSSTQQALGVRPRHSSRTADPSEVARRTAGFGIRLGDGVRRALCGVFLAFVIYPVGYGLWLGSDPALYAELFSDPIYLSTVANTLLYVGIGVNLKMFLAFLLSGFFMRKRWWVKTVLVIYILPWAIPSLPAFISIHWMLNGNWGFLNSALYELFGIDGPIWLNDRGLGMTSNIASYIWKNMPFWTVIFLAGRMAIPQELYEAAEVDGATGLRRFYHVTLPADGQPLPRFDPALDDLVTRRIQCGVLRHRRRAGDVHRGAGHARHPPCIRPWASHAWGSRP